MKLEEHSDPALRASKKNTAVLPVGSIEQHGPHLPVSTDSDIVSKVAERLCKRTGFLLLPTVRYGVSYEHAPLFHLSVRPGTLRAVLHDIIESLAQSGIRTVFVLNGHHGNQKALSSMVEKTEHTGISVAVLSYWHFMDIPFDHAGEAETSLMLALSERVDMKKASKGLITDGLSKAEIKRISRLASKSFLKATGNGVWGDPTKATAAQGRKILSQTVSRIRDWCMDYLADAEK